MIITDNAVNKAYDKNPRRFHGGCYFPSTDLCVFQNGRRGTGIPENVQWIDSPEDLPWYSKDNG